MTAWRAGTAPVTVSSGLLLFTCITLPAYRDCGHNTQMRDDAYLAGTCGIGLLVAMAALVCANRRHERVFAVASTVLASLVVALFALGVAAVRPMYAGITMGAATAASLWFGTVLWLRGCAAATSAAHW
jgi:hypothetical protein